MIDLVTARALVLGEVDAAAEAWEMASNLVESPEEAGREAFDLLALVGQLFRLEPDDEVRAARARALKAARQDVELVTQAAEAELLLPDWEKDARRLTAVLEEIGRDDVSERGTAAVHSAAAASARRLLLRLDEAELALWALRELGLDASLEVRAAVERAAAYLREHIECFVDAAELALAFAEDADPALGARDAVLHATTTKLRVLASRCLRPDDPLPELSPASRPGEAEEPEPLAVDEAARHVTLLRRRPALPPARRPYLAAAAPRVPGRKPFEVYRWRSRDERWVAVMEVPTDPAEGDARMVPILFEGEDGAPAGELDGASVILCGLELPVRRGHAIVPLGILRTAWEGWAPTAPVLGVRWAGGRATLADLVSPGLLADDDEGGDRTLRADPAAS